MLSYDLVEICKVGACSVHGVWIDGVSPKRASEINKNHQPRTIGKYVGRIVDVDGRWVAIPSFVDHGDPYGDIEIVEDDLVIYQDYKTRKKAVNQLRRMFNERLAEAERLRAMLDGSTPTS